MTILMNGKTSKRLRTVTISDVHLGHRRNTTEEILNNLDVCFIESGMLRDVDIFFIAGDFFDSLLNLYSEDVIMTFVWLGKFLRACKKHDVMVRVLEGTRSHDWTQSAIFECVNDVSKIECDVKYISTLHIERIERFNMDVLYVPDDYRPTTEETQELVKELLRAKGLTQVDFAVMHGQFPHQLPPGIKAPIHSSEFYLSIVRELIWIGHVHKPSKFERILAQGSFDRLSHGEQEAKGYYLVDWYGHHKWDINHIENIGAKKFITVPCIGLEITDALQLIDEKIANLPDRSYVRLEVAKNSPLATADVSLAVRYPQFTWNIKVIAEETETVDNLLNDDDFVREDINISSENIMDLLIGRLMNKNISSNILDICKHKLNEVI